MTRSIVRFTVCVFVVFAAASGFAATFSSTTSGNWSSSSTWGGAGVPGAGDTATVNGGHVVTLDVPVTVTTLTLGGGQINGTQSLSITSTFNWNGGTLSGSGSVTAAAVNLGGGGFLDGRTFNNNGAFTVTGGNYFYMQNNAAFNNSGTVDFQGDGGGIFQNGALGTTSITNNASGTIKKSGATGSTTIQIPIVAQSGSQFQAQSGTINIAAVTSTGATFTASSGAFFNFNTSDTRTFDAASTISGAGTATWSSGTNTVSGTISSNVTVIGGTLTINNASTQSIPALTMQGGTLAGSAPITLTGATQSWSGGTIAGTGLLTIPNTTTVTFTGYVYFDTRSISNAGTLTYTSSFYSYLYNSATLTNSGTVNFQGDGGFYIGSGSPAVTNSGVIEKSGGTGNGGIQVPLTLQSGAQLIVNSGTLLLGNVTATGATLSVGSGATAQFYYTTTGSFDAASTISGAGTVLFGAGTNTVNAAYNITGATSSSGGTTTIGTNNVTSFGNLTNSGGTLTINNSSAPSLGNITVSGGTLNLNISSTLSIPVLTMQGGTLAGTAPITLTGTAMTWSGGTVAGSGLLTIPNTTTITFTGYVYFDTRSISNAGTLNYTSNYYSYFYNSAALTNSGTVNFQGDGGFYIGSGSPSVINSGLIEKTGGASNGSIQVALTLQSGSQFEIESGTMLLGNVTATGATLSVVTGATAQFYYTTTSSFDAASSIGGAGIVLFAAGTNSVNAAYNVTGSTRSSGGTTTIGNITSVGNVVVTGGTLNLNSVSAVSVPTLSMQGGILAGTAPINLTAATMTWSGGTIAGTGQLSIPNTTTVTFTGYVYFDTRSINNAGTFNYTSSYYSYLYNGATLTNSGTVNFQGDGGFYIGSGSPSVIDSGLIEKSGGTGNGGIQVPLTLQSGGQLQIQSGTMLLGNITSTGGTISVSSGATAYFYYTTTSSFDAASTISGAGTVQFGAGTNTVSATYNITGSTRASGGTTTVGTTITSTGDIVMTGGTLTLNRASALSVPTLSMQGGILNGTSPISVTSASMTWTGGTVGGSGALSIPGGTTITVSGGVIIDGRPVSNAGTLSFTTTNYFYLQNNAVLTNSGTIDFLGDGGLFINGTVGTTSVVNSSIIRKSGGTGNSQITVPLTAQSGSQLLVQSGTMLTSAITSTGATFSISSGAVLNLYYSDTRTFDAATTIGGGGTLQVQGGTNTFFGTLTDALVVVGGTFTINSAGAQSIPTLTMQGGILSGTANLAVTGAAMTWSGGTISGSGTLSIPNATTVTLNGTIFFDGRPVSNAGAINLTSTNTLYLQNNAVVTNSGTLDIQSDGQVALNGTAGSTAMVNSGTIKKSGGTGSSNFTVPLTLQSGSQFLGQTGTLFMSAITGTGAAISISSGAVVNLYYNDTRTFDAASTVSGSGTLQVQGGTTTFAGTISARLTIAGGTFTLNSASAQSIPLLVMSGGTLNGSGNINITGAAMTWTGGTISGSGTLAVPGGTTITVAGYMIIDGRPVTNAGIINLTSTYYWYMQNNAVLTNSGTFDIQNDGQVYLNSVAGSTAVINSGTIKKSGGTATTTFSVPLTAQSGSQFLTQSGTVYMSAITNNGGAFAISNGAVLNLLSNDARTFDAASAISGAGTLQVQNGTTTFSGTLSSPLTMIGGTFNMNSAAAQTLPKLLMQGGNLGGSGNINVSTMTATWSGGSLLGSGTLSLASGSVVTLAGYVIVDGKPVINAGTINLTSTYYFYVQNNAVLTNSGTLDIQADGQVYLNSVPGTTAFNNSGIVKKSGGTVSGSTFNVPLNALSGSQFLVQAGQVYLGAVNATAGTFSVSSGATLNFYYSETRSFGASTTISGAGTLLCSNGVNTISGTISSAVSVSSGTLTINSASTQSIPALNISAGTFNGSGAVNLTGASMTWSGGTIGGSGALNVSAGTTLLLQGYPIIDGRPISNAGTIVLPSTYYTYMENGAALTNGGTIDFQGDANIYLAAASASITNNGLLKKSGGTGTSQITVATTNSSVGTIQPATGTLYFSSLAETGTLSFPIASATSFGHVQVASAFALGGTLTATTTGGYTPPNGTNFQVLTFTSSSGSFTTKFLNYTGGTFTDGYTATALTLTAGPSSCFSAPANVISIYKGEGSGNDGSGPNNATLLGGATTAAGKVGQALSFNGSSAYATAPNDPSLRPSSITIEGWVNFSSLPGSLAGFVGKTLGTSFFDSYAMWYDPSGTLRAEISDNSGEMQVTAAWSPATSTWYHVALTFDSGTQVETLYLNGAQVGTATYSGRQIAYDSHPLMIGADIQNETTQFFFPGLIDELTLYSRALSALEIQAIFNADTTGKCYVPPSAPTIGTVTPSSGPISGGTSVAVSGTNLDSVSSITFGGSAATVTARSATSLTVTTPAHAAGAVAVGATNPGGSASAPSAFTYVDPPTVSGFTPSYGPPGSSVVVTGSGFTTATSVTFAGTPASFIVNNDAQITATVPSGAINGVITVTNVAGSASSASSFVVSSASKLAVTSINGGVNPKRNVPFAITVQAQNASSVPANVVAATTVTLTLASGSGALGGTLTGVISAGASSVTISGLTYSVAEGGVSVTAMASGGDPLTAATSAPFTVNPAPSTYTVTNTNDAGTGSLREAITLANNGGCTAPCAIGFNIAGANPQTIALASPLPAIAQSNATIDGTTQPGYSGTPVIVLNGAAAGGGAIGLQIAASNTTVRGLTINSFNSHGVAITSGSGNLIAGNHIGTDAAGTTALPNGNGISIAASAGGNTIGGLTAADGNLIADNVGTGVIVAVGSTGNRILGNSTHDNGGLAIDLNGDGSTANDAGDADTGGGNNLQNAPVIVDASLAGTTLTAHVAVDSSSVVATGSLRVELFVADASGAEGSQRIATQCFAGNALTSQAITVASAPVSGGTVLVATATSYTDAACSSIGDGTSEFSAGVPVATCTPPSVSISPVSPAICAGGSVTLDAGAGFASYTWSTGATTRTITVSPASTTTYSVNVTDGTGCSNTASTIVTVSSSTATINPSGPTSFCVGGSVTLTANAGTAYSWSNGATTQSITVSASGTFTVTVTNGSCSATSAPTSVTVYPLPPTPAITANGPTTFCAGGSVTLSAPGGYAGYHWSNGALTQSIAVINSGSYSVTVTDIYGCAATSAPTTVTVTAAPAATITPSGPTTFCSGGSVTLTANAGASYLWYPNGATTQSITVNTTGYYSVAVTQAGGCSATSSQTYVIVNPPPLATIAASGPTTFCAGGSVTLSAPAGMTSYSWSNGATTQSINVSSSGTFTVTVTDASGCSATSAPRAVTVVSPPAATITPSGPTTFCTGGSVTLTAPAGMAAYYWSDGESTRSIAVNNSGSYSVTVTDANGCTTTSSPTSVTVNAAPAVNIVAGGPTSFCTGGSVTLTATAGFAGYQWSNGATTQAINVTTAGNYSVTATTANGCAATSPTTTVTVSSSSGVVAITAPGAVNAGSTGNVASVPAGPGGTTYDWIITNGAITAGNGTPSISFTAGASGTISLGVTVVSGACSSSGSASVTITAIGDLKLVMTGAPNPVSSGGTVTFTANLTNLGPNAAQNIAVVVNLFGATLTGATGPGWTCSVTSTVNCSMPSLPPGNAAPIAITATAANGPGTASADAIVLASSSDPNPNDNSAAAAVTISGPQQVCNNTAPSLIGPADGATVQSPVPFSWTASANAIGYDIWASTNNNAPAIVASTASTSLSVPLPAGPVSWYVGARFNNCPTLFSTPRTLTVAPATTCPTAKAQLISPLGGSVASPVTFNWTAASQAIGYRLWVEIDGGAPQDIATTGGATTAQVALVGSSVKWYVEAQFAGCASTFSDPATFTIAAPNPCANHEAAQLVAPGNDTTAASSQFLFDWNAVPHADGYRLWGSIDNAPFEVLGTTAAADTQLSATIAHGHVEWYVETLFNGCASTESPHRVVTVPAAQNCNSTPATNLAPSNVTLTNGAVDFSWSPVPNGIGYEVWLGLAGSTPSLLGTSATPTLHANVSAGALEFFVRTRFNGCDVADSAHAQFTFAPPADCPSAPPILVTPADGLQLVSPVDFSASALAGAKQYRLFIGNAQVATSPTPQFSGITVPVGPVSWSVEATFDACPPLRSTAGTFTAIEPPPPCADPPVPTLQAGATASDGVQYVVHVSPLPNALYEIQESANGTFGDAIGSTSATPAFTFSHVAPTAAPAVYHYRVRSINKCNGDRSQFSGEITVTVLSGKPADSNEANGSTPADNPQATHYKIFIGDNVGGASRGRIIAAAAGTPFTATTNVPWLTVTPSSGIVPDGSITLDVAANATGLAVGTNTGAVDVKLGASAATKGRIAALDGGSTTTTTVSINLVQPVSPTAKSGPPPDALIIPAVAHAAGVNSQFQSDVRLSNTASQTMKYQITFTPTGDEGNKNGLQTTVSVEPGRTIALDDVLQTWFGEQSASGTIEIRPLTATATTTSSKAVAGLANFVTFAASRTFNTTAFGTFGQYIPAIPFANFIGAASDPSKLTVLSLQQVAQSAAYRTNLGLVEGSGNPVTALISVFGSNGQKLTEFTQNLNGGQHLQMNGVLATKGLTLDDGRIEVRVTGGSGKLTAYASVLNNETNDPLLVSPIAVNALGASKYVVPGVAALNTGFANWQTDVRVFNAGTAPVTATATYVPQNGDVKTAQVTLAPGEVKVLDNALQTLFGITDSAGMLQFTTPNNSALSASARTYNVTGNGIYGQFIGGVTPNDAAGSGTRALQLLQIEESSRYRTNVGIAEIGGKPAKVEITVIPPDTKFTASTTVDLAPNQFVQYNSLIKQIGFTDDVYNARVTVRVIDGQGKVTSYASVIDMKTGDPTFVPAQ